MAHNDPCAQVELAGLAYKSVHLKSAMESKHLAQQRGGGAFLSGAGETNLEIERYMLAVGLVLRCTFTLRSVLTSRCG
jgi:50S ribosomal subunit-associated GTPase HflX